MSVRRDLLLGLLAVVWGGWWATEAAAHGQRQSNAPVDYNDESPNAASQQPIRIYQPGGREVSLQCGDKQSDLAKPNRRGFKPHSVIWHYKRCGSSKGMLACQDPNLADEWVILPCMKVGCKPTLDLGRPTSDSNGIYRCSLRNKSPIVPKILTSYELDIYDNAPELDLHPDVDNEPDFPLELPAPPVHMLRPAGSEVELQCKVQGYRKHHGVIWHYKQCSNNYKMSPCIQFNGETDVSDWKLVTCGGKGCNGLTLNLRNPTEDDNGLYRCSLRRAVATIVVTYELEIVEKANSSAEILGDSPRNLTVLSGQPAAFQCHVFSKVSPKVMWFRQRTVEEVPIDSKFIVYINDTLYEQMVSHQIGFPHEIYLSKLVLPSVRVSDSGLYICVALNNFGMTQRQVYLTVLPKYFQNSTTESDSGGSSHHWLFLIPATLALIPVTVWLCCRWRRKKRHARPCAESESLASRRPSLSSGNNNDQNIPGCVVTKVAKQTDRGSENKTLTRPS